MRILGSSSSILLGAGDEQCTRGLAVARGSIGMQRWWRIPIEGQTGLGGGSRA
ncbi:hypothetical protein ACP4OV_031699 [Aristida adscensionis]